MIGQLCCIESVNYMLIDVQVVGFNCDIIYLMLFKQLVGLMVGVCVFLEEKVYDILIGESWLGCVVNGFGELLDGKGCLNGNDFLLLLLFLVNFLICCLVDELLDVGVKVINGLLIIGKGQCVGLMVGSGVGKSVLLGMIICQIKVDIVVVGLIGECGCEVKEFIDYLLGVDGLVKFIVVVVFVDELLLMCLKVIELCYFIVVWFCDCGYYVLLLVDFLICYVMVQWEIVFLFGELFVIKGYLLLVFGMIFKLVESVGNSESVGLMIVIYIVLVEGDDQ